MSSEKSESSGKSSVFASDRTGEGLWALRASAPTRFSESGCGVAAATKITAAREPATRSARAAGASFDLLRGKAIQREKRLSGETLMVGLLQNVSI